MATIQTVTTKDAQLEIFGSLTVAELTAEWWASHKGAIVFPTDENKVYFGGVAYDGLNDTDLQAALSSYVTKNDLSTALADYVKSADFASLFTTQLNAQLPTNVKFKAVETQASTNATNISTLDAKVDQTIADVEAVAEALGDKQDKLTAGDGISIENNVISSTLDLTLYKVVTALPSSNPDPTKIYLVKSAESTTNDIYEEYIWTGTAFEKLGEYKSDVDLTPYLKKTEIGTVLEGVTAADNNGTEVTIGQGTGTNTQIKAAIIIQ